MTLTPQIKSISLPDFGPAPETPPPPSAEKLLDRIAAVRQRMETQRLTHLVIYADREHTANLTWLTNFDARFEEALLILQFDRDPLLITGNECADYLPVSALHDAGRLRHELFQDFSLLDQPRDKSRALREILAGEGIGAASRVGSVGWKYFDSPGQLEIPSFIADLLRDMAGRHNVVNASAMFMHAGHGLRSIVDAGGIATFEFANWHASESMKRMILGLKEGMSDFDVVSLAGVNGLPLGCHITFATGAHHSLGLSGPTGQRMERGSPLSMNIGYWRANVCRSAWLAEGADDLPTTARDYVEAFAGPYVAALAQWFGMMRIGVEGGDIQEHINRTLPRDRFGISLNPGHLIDIDEWLSSPIFPGSKLPLRSGMMIQVDIIPSSSVYGSTRMEDGIAIADAEMRRDLKSLAPAVYERCMARRRFMENVIGIPLPGEVLPLSNMAGIVQPFLMAPDKVIALS